MEKECKVHGLTSHAKRYDGYYRCRKCNVVSVKKRRAKILQLLVKEAGGGCKICGYNKYKGALEFHHLDPAKKEFAINAAGRTWAIERLRAEAAKCVLLCANCHREVEAGVTQLVE